MDKEALRARARFLATILTAEELKHIASLLELADTFADTVDDGTRLGAMSYAEFQAAGEWAKAITKGE